MSWSYNPREHSANHERIHVGQPRLLPVKVEVEAVSIHLVDQLDHTHIKLHQLFQVLLDYLDQRPMAKLVVLQFKQNLLFLQE